jgi:hypothetical protein
MSAITYTFLYYMESIYRLSTGKIGEADTEKRDYRNKRGNRTDGNCLRNSPALQNWVEIFSRILAARAAAERAVCDKACKMRMAEVEGNKIALADLAWHRR